MPDQVDSSLQLVRPGWVNPEIIHNPALGVSPDTVIDQSVDQVEAATVDPDEAQFRSDAILMHGELLELELYRIRRELFENPSLLTVWIGAGQQAEQTFRGNQHDPFSGVTVFNPTAATLALGFQAGAGQLAPIVIPPKTWITLPQRYVNLSLYVPNTADQQAATASPVTVLRLRVPPAPAAGPYSS